MTYIGVNWRLLGSYASDSCCNSTLVSQPIAAFHKSTPQQTPPTFVFTPKTEQHADFGHCCSISCFIWVWLKIWVAQIGLECEKLPKSTQSLDHPQFRLTTLFSAQMPTFDHLCWLISFRSIPYVQTEKRIRNACRRRHCTNPQPFHFEASPSSTKLITTARQKFVEATKSLV